jgi:MoxR-like ATPase
MEYSVNLARATRDPGAVGLGAVAKYITFGASPRASINMILAAKALAVLRGRDYAIPDDVRDIALDVLRHRIVLSYEALTDNVSPDDILIRVLKGVGLPDPSQHRQQWDSDASVGLRT